MPYSTKCNTPLSNFEANQNYKEVNDPAGLLIVYLVNRSFILHSALEQPHGALLLHVGLFEGANSRTNSNQNSILSPHQLGGSPFI